MGGGIGAAMLVMFAGIFVVGAWALGTLLFRLIEAHTKSSWRLLFVGVICLLPPAYAANWINGLDRQWHNQEALVNATASEDVQKVAALLKDGASPDCYREGRCALDDAMARENWKLIRLLIDYGAKNHRTPNEKGMGLDAALALETRGQPDLAGRLRANGDEGTLKRAEED